MYNLIQKSALLRKNTSGGNVADIFLYIAVALLGYPLFVGILVLCLALSNLLQGN